jgi:diketogulonate reductase-like aldo/keto reductase
MQRARELGYTRSIGVSNFDISELDKVMSLAGDAPVVNQIQMSPFNYRRALIDEAHQRGIVVEAYSPLGTGRHLSNAAVGRMAARLGRTPAQVLLRWCIQHDLVVLPKSTHEERIKENAQIFDFVLPGDAMAELDSLDRTAGTGRALERKWW